ncbi:ATP-binding protein [Bradyrhizobium sp. C-145]|uniref:AAA family ATPase n=1 Tax=Bradyrhizobium sp. C-145 TaxID=574727 RepID=UPI00201B89AC|nr:AAA family ATPase [Bradyrhizobium sp. C-145]UQR61817.1 ATP-binding protein [Bradyrhizobium sp. C-145]
MSEGGGDMDDKELTLSRRNLEVTVRSIKANKTIPLDALSSGEKQMISLLAKLFLYPDNKIILIDEPELSLSIDWQKQILLDVMNAPLCKQVIAITHSPFIFDNALEPFARSFVSTIDPVIDDTEEDAHE